MKFIHLHSAGCSPEWVCDGSWVKQRASEREWEWSRQRTIFFSMGFWNVKLPSQAYWSVRYSGTSLIRNEFNLSRAALIYLIVLTNSCKEWIFLNGHLVWISNWISGQVRFCNDQKWVQKREANVDIVWGHI